MNIRKYFWGLNEKAIKETQNILKNPDHFRFVSKFYTILSRCDNIKEVFSIITKEQFVKVWPKTRHYWIKRDQASDFRAWWETVYEGLLEKHRKTQAPKGTPLKILRNIGIMVRNSRIDKGWTQFDFAKRIGVDQAYISRIEKGKKNFSVETLLKICKIMDIKNISVQ